MKDGPSPRGGWREVIAPDIPVRRPLTGVAATASKAIALAFACYYIYAALRFVDPSIFLAAYVGFTGLLAFLCFPASKRSPTNRPSALDWLLAAATLATTIYYIWSFDERLMSAGGRVGVAEVAFGTIAVAVSLEMCRRLLGPILPLIAMVLIAYNIWGSHFPAAIAHNGIAFDRFISFAYSEEGIFGVVTSTFATYVFLFILFGAFLQSSGIGQIFIDMAFSLFGSSRGGAGKVAVVASGLLGSVLGSGAGNVLVTGSVTIPLMKRHGFKPEYAGGVEAVASLGGHIMPPVMGAAAFVVAAFTHTDYATILLISIVPALLYYVSLFFTVHFYACRNAIGGMERGDVPSLRKVWRQNWFLLTPIWLLIGMLVAGYSAYFTAVCSILAIMAVSALKRASFFSLRWIVDTLVDGAIGSVIVGVTGGVMGIVLAGALLPGLALKFSSLVLTYSFGLLPVLIMLILLISLIFGMGMTILAAYIVLAILAQPAMLEFGIPLLTIHMMLLWISQAASITPPFCINAFIAANIANANPMKTGFNSVYLGQPIYILPILFVYTPMLMDGPWDAVIATWVTCALAIIATASVMEGYLLAPLSWIQRGGVAVAAILLYWPDYYSDAAGLVLGALLLWLNGRARFGAMETGDRSRGVAKPAESQGRRP